MQPTQPVLIVCSLILSLAAAPLPAQTSPVPSTLQVYSRETDIDVTVTDAKGNPVHGLKQSDFTVLEDGRPITLRSFREHSSGDSPAPAPAAPTLPPNTFTNQGPPEGVRPLDILLLDDLDTPIATQSILNKQLADLVEKLAPGTRVAVFGLSGAGQLNLLQGFTSDPQLLKKAVKAQKVQVPPLEDTGQDANTDTQAALIQAPDSGKMLKPAEPQQPRIDQDMECNHTAARGMYTFSALSEIARYVSGMPGRKNLIWFTGMFPQAMRNKQGVDCFNFSEDFRVVGERLGHSHIAIYPIDPRSLDIMANQGPDSRIGRLQVVEDLRMVALAQDSGGTAYSKTNDLAGAAAQALDYGSNYYAITYIPPNQNMDTRRRSVSIKVDQPGLTLIYRPYYHAVPLGETVSGQTIHKATPLQTAMLRGALQPTEILFHVSVAPASTNATLPPGNNVNPKAMKPPYRHLTLSYTVDLTNIPFDLAPDGNYHGQFEYAVYVYDSRDGNLLDSSDMAAKPALPPAVYQSMLASGARFRQEIAVPDKGEFTLRVGIHDLTTDRVGAVEIPAASITP